MKHLNFILPVYFSCAVFVVGTSALFGRKCGAEHQGRTNQRKTAFARWVKTCPVVLIIAGSGPTDMDGNSAIGNLRNNSLKFLAKAWRQTASLPCALTSGIGTSASAVRRKRNFVLKIM